MEKCNWRIRVPSRLKKKPTPYVHDNIETLLSPQHCKTDDASHIDLAHKPQQPHNCQNATANWEPAKEEDLKVVTNCPSRVGYTGVLPLNGILNLNWGRKKNIGNNLIISKARDAD